MNKLYLISLVVLYLITASVFASPIRTVTQTTPVNMKYVDIIIRDSNDELVSMCDGYIELDDESLIFKNYLVLRELPKDICNVCGNDTYLGRIQFFDDVKFVFCYEKKDLRHIK